MIAQFLGKIFGTKNTRIFCAEYLAEELSNHKVPTNICGRIKVNNGGLRARWRRSINKLGRID